MNEQVVILPVKDKNNFNPKIFGKAEKIINQDYQEANPSVSE